MASVEACALRAYIISGLASVEENIGISGYYLILVVAESHKDP
jgi:hypothetical protein